MTRRETTDHITTVLTPLYGDREARSIALRVVTELTGLSLAELLTDPGVDLTIEGLNGIVARLAEGHPVQYVLGYTEFYGLEIAVREGVLIPRPETEELVAWIAKEEKAACTLLDVGCGSGCIALGIKANLTDIQVFAADISDDALAVAAENAHKLKLEMTLRKANALSNLSEVFPEKFDVIVSNPPYVPQSDLQTMHINVRDHEPHLALFVPDDDKLLFYTAIAHTGQQMLRPGGRLYFEIYHRSADAICTMLGEAGYTDITLREDLAGKPRMVRCRMK